jgi:uncharacterized Zn-finger protein
MTKQKQKTKHNPWARAPPSPALSQNYCCDTCGYSTERRSDMTKHQRIHSGIKPFTCKTCNKSFTQSSHLKAHERVHSNARFICYLCGHSYRSLRYLLTHKTTHFQHLTTSEVKTLVRDKIEADQQAELARQFQMPLEYSFVDWQKIVE